MARLFSVQSTALVFPRTEIVKLTGRTDIQTTTQDLQGTCVADKKHIIAISPFLNGIIYSVICKCSPANYLLGSYLHRNIWQNIDILKLIYQYCAQNI